MSPGARSIRSAASAALLAAVVLAASTRPTPAPEASPGASAADRARYDKVADEILCYCGCARQTIKECSCSVAFQLREQIEAKLAAGMTPDAIVAEYIDEHGEQSRNAPVRKGLNLVAWFGPAVMILAAGGVMVAVLIYRARHRAAAAAAGAPPEGAAGSAGTDGTVQSGAGDVADSEQEARSRRKLEDALREIDI